MTAGWEGMIRVPSRQVGECACITLALWQALEKLRNR